MPGVTKQQIAKAKEWDLLSYLMVHEPEELKKSGPAHILFKLYKRRDLLVRVLVSDADNGGCLDFGQFK